jgi:hypothetical protein
MDSYINLSPASGIRTPVGNQKPEADTNQKPNKIMEDRRKFKTLRE